VISRSKSALHISPAQGGLPRMRTKQAPPPKTDQGGDGKRGGVG
jgi:hypothetical protein